MRKWTALVLVVLIMAAGGCKGDETESVPSMLGQPVETEFFTFTVTETFWGEGGPEANPPEEGMDYLWVGMEVHNPTNEELPLYYDEFDLYIQGEPRFPQRVFHKSQLAEDQVLAAGQTVSGYLVYLAPREGKDLTLSYQVFFQGDRSGEQYDIPLKPEEISASQTGE